MRPRKNLPHELQILNRTGILNVVAVSYGAFRRRRHGLRCGGVRIGSADGGHSPLRGPVSGFSPLTGTGMEEQAGKNRCF